MIVLTAILTSYMAANLGIAFFAWSAEKSFDWSVGGKQIPAGFIKWMTLIGLVFAGSIVGAFMLVKRKPSQAAMEELVRQASDQMADLVPNPNLKTYAPDVPPVMAGQPSPGGP